MKDQNLFMIVALIIFVLVLGGFFVMKLTGHDDKGSMPTNEGQNLGNENVDSAKVSDEIDNAILDENQEIELGEMIDLS